MLRFSHSVHSARDYWIKTGFRVHILPPPTYSQAVIESPFDGLDRPRSKFSHIKTSSPVHEKNLWAFLQHLPYINDTFKGTQFSTALASNIPAWRVKKKQKPNILYSYTAPQFIHKTMTFAFLQSAAWNMALLVHAWFLAPFHCTMSETARFCQSHLLLDGSSDAFKVTRRATMRC